MLNFLKRCAAALFAAATVLTALPGMAVSAQAEETVLAQPYSLTGEELVERIGETYDNARAMVGWRGFNGRCSTMVNCSAVVLGIQNIRYNGDGRDVYDVYADMSRTDCGYDVAQYPSGEYDLESALNAISENGTRDVYNIVVGFESGRTGSSSAYGHAMFIHGIVDGQVYFSESYGLYLEGNYYSEGEPIVCTIAEFANYYNIWACFEGAVHFDFPDESAPEMTELEVLASSENGFLLSFQATDNIEITEIYAKVWTYGQTEEDAVTVPVTWLGDTALIRVDSGDFDGFVGWYYVNCYASDRKGNTAVTTMAKEGVSLYQAENASGVYRVLRDNTGIYNAPYIRVNEVNTRISVVNAGAKVTIIGSYVNDDGENWYLLADGGWIPAESLTQEKPVDWADLWAYIRSVFSISKTVNIAAEGRP